MTRDELIEKNMKLVYHVAHKTKNIPMEFDDIVGFGMIGLVKAANDFDPSRGNKFATVAVTYIQNEIFIELRKEARRKGLKLEGVTAVSIHTEVSQKGKKNLSYEDIIEDVHATIDKELLFQDSLEDLMDALETLPEKEKISIIHFYGIGEKKKTQNEIAKILNVSQSHVSRYVRQGIKKLRKKVIV